MKISNFQVEHCNLFQYKTLFWIAQASSIQSSCIVKYIGYLKTVHSNYKTIPLMDILVSAIQITVRITGKLSAIQMMNYKCHHLVPFHRVPLM